MEAQASKASVVLVEEVSADLAVEVEWEEEDSPLLKQMKFLRTFSVEGIHLLTSSMMTILGSLL